jgi:hypothetical protein
MTKLKYVLLISGVLLVAVAIAGVAQPSQSGAANPSPTTITVTGNGSVNATPDKASFDFGVQVNGANAAEATNQANAKANAIVDALKRAGIPDSDIQTSSVSLWPQTSNDGQTITGYQASYSVTVTSPIDKASSLVDDATGAGANTVNGPSLSVGDQSSYYAQALKLAVGDAKTQAQAIADAAGLNLGGIIHITNESSAPGPIYYADAAGSAKESLAPIEAGSQQISATVTVVYSAS